MTAPIASQRLKEKLKWSSSKHQFPVVLRVGRKSHPKFHSFARAPVLRLVPPAWCWPFSCCWSSWYIPILVNSRLFLSRFDACSTHILSNAAYDSNANLDFPWYGFCKSCSFSTYHETGYGSFWRLDWQMQQLSWAEYWKEKLSTQLLPMAPGTLCVWGREAAVFFCSQKKRLLEKDLISKIQSIVPISCDVPGLAQSGTEGRSLWKTCFLFAWSVSMYIYIYIFSFFAFVCLFVSSSFVFVSLCFFVCFLFMCLSIIISLGKKDAWAWICFYIIIIIYIYIYTNIYIYIYTSRYSYIHLHGSLDPCRLYQHVLPECLRSPALTGPCQALLQKLLFLGCGIGDGVSWVSIALSNIRQGEQYSIGLFGQVTVKSGMFLGLAIGGSEPCAVILFFSSYTRYTFRFTWAVVWYLHLLTNFVVHQNQNPSSCE